MKQIKKQIMIILTLASSLSQAGLTDWFLDRGLEVHRLAAGETRVIRGLTVTCVHGLESLLYYTRKGNVFYMNAVNEAIRDRIPGVSLYCGSRSDRNAHDSQHEISKRFVLACLVNMNRDSGQVQLTIYDKEAQVTTDRFDFPASQLELANAACMKNQTEGICECRALPVHLVQ